VVEYNILPGLARDIIARERIVFLVTDPLRAAKENITRADHREIYDCIMTLPDPETKLANLEQTMIMHTGQFLRELEGTDWYVITRDDASTVEDGNLVCPAVYDLGQAANVVALSVTEGEDKPLKYPTMFHKADLVLLTKIDLLPALPDVSVERIEANLSAVMPRPAMLRVSARTGEGMSQWLRWLAGIGRPRAAQCAIAGAGLVP
jgi:hypothetical protein